MAMATTALLSSPTNSAAPQRHHPIRGHHIPLLGRGYPREADAAVAELLLDHSASPADAAAIAARAPAYAAMLVDAVRQLDELGLWASWGGAREGAGMGALGFGTKAYFMSRSRRAVRVVPLVESLGVRLSSAKLIAP